jgi:hypothetical protein
MISGQEAADYLNISLIVLERYIHEGKLNVYYQPSPDDDVPLFDRAELAQLNHKGHILPIEPTIDSPEEIALRQRDFDLVAMPSRELMSGFLPPFAELSEMALFDRQELEYFSDGELIPLPSTELMSGFLLPSTRSIEKSASILPIWDDFQNTNNPPYTTQNESVTTKNPQNSRLTHQQVSMASTGLLDVFLVLCAQSVGNLFSSLTDRSSPKIPPAMLKGKLLLNLAEAQILSGLSRTILMNAIKNHELPFQLIGRTYYVKSKDLEQFVDNL